MKNKIIYQIVGFVLIAILSGCGNSDDGEVAYEDKRLIQGFVFAPALVANVSGCIDINENFLCENDEVSFTTDENGRIFKEVTVIDYPALKGQTEFLLIVNIIKDEHFDFSRGTTFNNSFTLSSTAVLNAGDIGANIGARKNLYYSLLKDNPSFRRDDADDFYSYLYAWYDYFRLTSYDTISSFIYLRDDFKYKEDTFAFQLGFDDICLYLLQDIQGQINSSRVYNTDEQRNLQLFLQKKVNELMLSIVIDFNDTSTAYEIYQTIDVGVPAVEFQTYLDSL